MGMYGIKQFDAVINPPQAMIMAIGAGEKRPYVIDDALQIATVMSATGSFDHRAIDGADGARLMKAFKALVRSRWGWWLEMKWMTALILGAILAFILPTVFGGQAASGWISWTEWGTIRPHAGSPGLLFSIPVFLGAALAFRLFFNWHTR